MKLRKMRKLLLLLLTFALSVAMFAGCGDDDDDDDDDDRKSSSVSDDKNKGNSTITEPGGKIDTGDPDEAALKSGEYLYKEFPDQNLNGITKTPPYSVSVIILTDTGRNVNLTADEAAVAKLSKAFAAVKVGSYVGDTAETKLNSITFRWNDGSETEILFYGTKLAYKTGGKTQVYELDGTTELWAAATGQSTDQDDGLEEVVCTEQKFKTKIKKGYPAKFDEDAGLYYGTNPDYSADAIPYVMIYRFGDVGIAAKDFLTEYTLPGFKNAYGDNLLQVTEQEELTAEFADGQKRKLYGMRFRYDAAGKQLWMYRLVGEFDGEIVAFTAKYHDGKEWSENQAMEALEIAVVYFELTDKGSHAAVTPTPTPGGSKKPGTGKTQFDIRVVESEASKVTYEKYDNGLFSAEIPKGWVVSVHDLCDYIHYTFQIYDPKNPDLRILFNMKTEDYWASKKDHDMFATYYPGTATANMPWVDPQTTEVFFPVFFDYLQDTTNFKYRRTTNFTKIESLGRDVLGGEIIHATSVNAEGGKVEGVYACTIVPINLYYATALYVYNTYYMTAPEGELSNWIGVLEHTFSSIEFSKTFQRQLSQELTTISQATVEIGKICSQTTDIVNSGWESRSAAYDRISQKQSDATLGYERVYDTEKNEIYRAPLDFFDSYTGDRYTAVTDDQYLLPIDGYIEWK